MILTGEAIEQWAKEQASTVERAVRPRAEVRVTILSPGVVRMTVLDRTSAASPIVEIYVGLQGDWQSEELEYDPELGAVVTAMLVRPQSRRRVWWARGLFGKDMDISLPEQGLTRGSFGEALASELARYGFSFEVEGRAA